MSTPKPWRYRRVPDAVTVPNPDPTPYRTTLADCWYVLVDGAVIGTIGKDYWFGISNYLWASPELPGTCGVTRDEMAAKLVARTQRPHDEPEAGT